MVAVSVLQFTLKQADKPCSGVREGREDFASVVHGDQEGFYVLSQTHLVGEQVVSVAAFGTASRRIMSFTGLGVLGSPLGLVKVFE